MQCRGSQMPFGTSSVPGASTPCAELLIALSSDQDCGALWLYFQATLRVLLGATHRRHLRLLAAAPRWVNGDPRHFRRWADPIEPSRQCILS